MGLHLPGQVGASRKFFYPHLATLINDKCLAPSGTNQSSGGQSQPVSLLSFPRPLASLCKRAICPLCWTSTGREEGGRDRLRQWQTGKLSLGVRVVLKA